MLNTKKEQINKQDKEKRAKISPTKKLIKKVLSLSYL